MLGVTEVRRLMLSHGIDADRRLGQNFVTDPGTLRRMVSLAGVGAGSQVLEIGPGIGSLTLVLASSGASVLAVEKDSRLLPVLSEVLDSAGVEPSPVVVQGDALELAWPELLAAHTSADMGRQPAEWKVVANLPYNIAVPIITGLLEGAPDVTAMWVMVQLEVAQRLCASPGGRGIGVPTIRVGWFAEASIAMTVAPEVFTPRPRVRSAVVQVRRRPPPVEDVDPEALFALVGRAFRQRRKMLRSSIGYMVSAEAFETAAVDPTSRPEELSVHDWGRLGILVAPR